MTEETHETANRTPVGNLTDFVHGVDDKNPLHVEVAIKDDGRVVVFHDKPFKNQVSWFEFDLGTNKFDFIMDEGELRDFGMPLHQSVAKHMQNSHQILMILLDDDTGEGIEGNSVPLIIHRT